MQRFSQTPPPLSSPLVISTPSPFLASKNPTSAVFQAELNRSPPQQSPIAAATPPATAGNEVGLNVSADAGIISSL